MSQTQIKHNAPGPLHDAPGRAGMSNPAKHQPAQNGGTGIVMNGGAPPLEVGVAIATTEESAFEDSHSSEECIDPFKAILDSTSIPVDKTLPTESASMRARSQKREVISVPQTSHSALAQTLPTISKRPQYQHFNSKGEIVSVAEISSIKAPTLLQNPYPNPNINIRVCMRLGCGSLLQAENPDAFCAHCTKNVVSRPASPLDPYTKWKATFLGDPPAPLELQYPEDDDTSSTSVSGANDTSGLSFLPPALPQAKSGKQKPVVDVRTNSADNAPAAEQIVPKRQAVVIPHRPRVTLPSQVHVHPKVKTTMEPPATRYDARRNQYPVGSSTGPAPPPAPIIPPQPNLKSCVTPGCSGLIHMQSAAKRCPKCVMLDWKDKMKSLPKSAPKVASTPEPATVTPPPPTPAPTTTPPSLLSDIIQKAFQLPPTPSPTKSKPTSAAEQPAPSADNAVAGPSSQRVLLRIPSKRKLEEMIDSTKSASSSLKKQDTKEESSASAPSADAMDVDSPPVSQGKGKGKAKMVPHELGDMDVDLELSDWDSDLTALSELELCSNTTDEEEEPSNPKLIIRLPPRSSRQVPNPPGTHYRQRVNGTLLSEKGTKAPPGPLGWSEKVCAITKCKNLLPQDYKWKCCRDCRKHHREYQRRRLGVMKGTFTAEKDDEETSKEMHQVVERQPDVVVQEPLVLKVKIKPALSEPAPPAVPVPDVADTGERVCVIRGCTLKLPPVYQYKWKLCKDCRKRTNKTRLRRQLRAEGKEDKELDKEIDRLHAVWKQRIAAQAEVEKPRVSAYPEYASLPLLINEFSQRIMNFFDAQAMYAIHHKPSRFDGATMMTFGFDGEYSVVAMDVEIVGRQDAILDFAGRITGEMERVSGLLFDPRTRMVSFQHGGVLTRYMCSHAVGPAMVMKGELEIAILPEYSHRYFPGQRTVVRFRMVS